MSVKENSTSKAVCYRKASFGQKQDQTLQSLVKSALMELKDVQSRTEPINSESTTVRVIGEYKDIGKMLCGYLSTWERGRYQQIITDDPHANRLTLGAIPPSKTKDGKPNEYIPGVLYFVIFDNHIAFVQTQSIRNTALETHLAWLLKSKTNLLPVTTSVVLGDEIQKATKDFIRKSHVKSISFGQPLITGYSPEVDRAPVSKIKHSASLHPETTERKKFEPSGGMWEFIKEYFDDSQFEKLGFDDVFDGSLEVWIELRYPKRKRKHTEETIKLMDNLAIGLRDIEGEQVSLKLANGHVISGDKLKISGSINVSLLNNGLLNTEDVWKGLAGWLANQIENGGISPD